MIENTINAETTPRGVNIIAPENKKRFDDWLLPPIEWFYVFLLVLAALAQLVLIPEPQRTIVFRALPQPEEMDAAIHASALGNLMEAFQCVAMGVGVAIMVVFFVRRLRGGAETLPGWPVTWRIWDIAKVSAAFFLFGAIGYYIAPIPWQSIAFWYCDWLARAALIALGLWVVLVERRGTLAELGVTRRWRPAVAAGLLVFCAISPFIFGAQAVIVNLFPAAQAEAMRQGVIAMFGHSASVGIRAAITISAVVFAPLAEEFFFRGMLQGWLQARVGVIAGIVLSAIAFSLIHFDLVSAPGLFILGLGCAYAYHRTRSLWAPVTIHFVQNAASMAVIWVACPL